MLAIVDNLLVLIRRSFGILAAAMVVSISGILLAHVAARYVFHIPLTWSDEVMRFLVVGLTFTGLALSIAEDSILKVDVIDSVVGPRIVSVLRAIGGLLVAAAIAALIVGGVAYTQRFFHVPTPSARIPRGLIYGPIVATLVFSAAASLLQSAHVALGGKDDSSVSGDHGII